MFASPTAAKVDPLHLSLQNIDDLLSCSYWLLACPFLTCSVLGIPAALEEHDKDATFEITTTEAPCPIDFSDTEIFKAASDAELDTRRQVALNNKGYFRVDASCTGILPATLQALEKGVSTYLSIRIILLAKYTLLSFFLHRETVLIFLSFIQFS